MLGVVAMGKNARVQCELLLAGSFIVLCWTLNLHWYVLLGSSKKITSRDHWITAFSQINGRYFSRCPSCIRLCAYGPFEDCQVRMFVKQRRTHGWSSCLPGKNIFVTKQKSSNLYIIMFEVSENVSEYVFMHTAVACVRKCFTREGHLKSAKNECLWNSVENTAEAVTCSLH